MKQVDSKLLLGLLVGAVIGGAAAYLATSDKKEEWLDELNTLATKAKTTLDETIALAKSKYAEKVEAVAAMAKEEAETVATEV